MNENMVDIIVPAYNNAGRIGLALDSAVAQTYANIQIIVVDDGSTDKTSNIVREYIQRYPGKIRYFYQCNRGPASARNKAIKEGNGEYIAFLDADDIWCPYKLEKQVNVLRNNPKAGFVYTDNNFVDEAGRLIENYVRQVKLIRGDVALDLFLDHFLMTPAVMLRKKCIESVGLFNEELRVGEDYEFFLRLARKHKAEVIDEKLWKRAVIKDSLSRQDYRLDARNDLKTLAAFLEENPEFYRQHKVKTSARLAEYYFSFGYRLLDEGQNAPAFKHLFQSLKYKLSLRTLKNLFLCGIPYRFRYILKGQLCQKSV